MFCKLDHDYVFRKDNRNLQLSEGSCQMVENIPTSILCDQCGEIFEKKDDYKKHMSKACTDFKEPQQLVECGDCSFVCERRSDMNYHVSQKHKEIDFECDLCGIYLVSQEELLEHKKKMHTEVKENGGKEAGQNSEIVALNNLLENLLDKKPVEVKTSEETKSFQCEKCKNSYENEKSLVVHTRRKHETTQERSTPEFTCGLCVISFESVEEMDTHMDDNHGGRWKLYDDDVILEGEDYEESSTDCTNTDHSETENSESQSGEE